MHEVRQRMEGYERQQHHAWEIARWQEWHQTMLNPYIKPADRPKTPKALVCFPWEQPDEARVKPADCHLTKEQIAELNKIFNL